MKTAEGVLALYSSFHSLLLRGGALISLGEIAGYCDMLNVIHESFDAIPITKNYILQLHKILYSSMNNPIAGLTKNLQNYISATYPDGYVKILFTPLAPFETPEALDRICTDNATGIKLERHFS